MHTDAFSGSTTLSFILRACSLAFEMCFDSYTQNLSISDTHVLHDHKKMLSVSEGFESKLLIKLMS